MNDDYMMRRTVEMEEAYLRLEAQLDAAFSALEDVPHQLAFQARKAARQRPWLSKLPEYQAPDKRAEMAHASRKWYRANAVLQAVAALRAGNLLEAHANLQEATRLQRIELDLRQKKGRGHTAAERAQAAQPTEG